MGYGGPSKENRSGAPRTGEQILRGKRGAYSPSLTFCVPEGAEWPWEGHWHPFKLCLGFGDLTVVALWGPFAQLGPQRN